MNTDTEFRDMLALERTRLANERTFLAYIRTGLALLAASAVLFQYFSTLRSYVVVAWFLAIGGITILGVGLVRFMIVRKRLDERT